MIENQQDFDDMEKQASNIRDKALYIKNDARSLEREARRRNYRLIGVMVCIGVSLLLYLIVPRLVD